jgi:1-deoxy-D-xylulose-5-phosphate synthase
VTHGSPALLHAEVGFTGREIARRVEAELFAGRGEVLSEA